jgi:DNA-binding response OmpR family regulator
MELSESPRVSAQIWGSIMANSAPTVLVVDDEAVIRTDIGEYLSSHGFNVLEAEDGARAIKVLQNRADINAVFADIQMPGDVDGFALRNWMRQNRSSLPILFTSGVTNVVTAAGHLGPPRWIIFKPYDPAEVETRLRALLGSGH